MSIYSLKIIIIMLIINYIYFRLKPSFWIKRQERPISYYEGWIRVKMNGLKREDEFNSE